MDFVLSFPNKHQWWHYCGGNSCGRVTPPNGSVTHNLSMRCLFQEIWWYIRMQEGGKRWSCNNTKCKGSLHFPGNKLPNKKKHTATKTAGIHFQKFHISRHHHLPCSSPQVPGMNFWHMSRGCFAATIVIRTFVGCCSFNRLDVLRHMAHHNFGSEATGSGNWHQEDARLQQGQG